MLQLEKSGADGYSPLPLRCRRFVCSAQRSPALEDGSRRCGGLDTLGRLPAAAPSLCKTALEIGDVLLDVDQHLLVVVQGIVGVDFRPEARGAVRDPIPHFESYLSLKHAVERNRGKTDEFLEEARKKLK